MTNCSFNVNSDFILCFCDFILFKLLTLICEKGGIAYLAGTFSSKSAMTNPLSIITESFGSKTDYTRSSCDVFIRDNNLFSMSYRLSEVQVHSGRQQWLWSEVSARFLFVGACTTFTLSAILLEYVQTFTSSSFLLAVPDLFEFVLTCMSLSSCF